MVQKFLDAKYQTPSDIHCNWRKGWNYVGRDISTPIPFYFHSQNDRGFKILWMEYIEHSSYFLCYWRRGSKYDRCVTLYPLSISNSNWKEGSKYYCRDILNPIYFLFPMGWLFKILWMWCFYPLLIFTAFREGVLIIMTANWTSFYF